MKRLLLLAFPALLFTSSCDSLVTRSDNDTQQTSPRTQMATQIPLDTPRVQADSVRKAMWLQFVAANGLGWHIRWSKATGLPVSIYAGLTRKKYTGSARQAARAFIADHQTLLGVTSVDELKYVKTQIYRGVRHITFNQTVKGVPVYEGEYKVHLRPNGQVDMVNGTFYPNIKVSTNPSVSSSGAINTAQSDLGIKPGTKLQTTSTLVIYRQQEQFRLAWKLTLFSEQPFADWFYIVDAQSGKILYKLNQLTDVTGDGDVYPTHPGLSSVTNKSFYRLSGNGRLQGTYAYVVNDETSEAYSASHSFQYSPSNTHFDEANLYYHVDRYRHDFIDGVDNGSLGFTQITAHAHANSPYYGDTNAWFSASTKDIYFGDASSSSVYNDFAREDKVIYHEYGHAVIYDIQSGIASESSEEGAISEGTPDYFAGSFTGRPVIGDYIGSTRDMANPDISSYSEYESRVPAEAHDGGEFFSAILWDLHSSISPATEDFLVYDALYRVTSDPDFLEFRDAMIAADNAAYSGSHNDVIQNTFADWGVGHPVYTSPAIPTNLVITNISSTGPPNLNWDDNSEPDLDHYNVYRIKKRLSDGYIFPPVYIGSASTSSYTDSWVIMGSGKPYDFRYFVQAVSPGGSSGYSNKTPWVNGVSPM